MALINVKMAARRRKEQETASSVSVISASVASGSSEYAERAGIAERASIALDIDSSAPFLVNLTRLLVPLIGTNPTTWQDAAANAVKVAGDFYAEGTVAARAAASGETPGGGTVSLLKQWNDYNAAAMGDYALSAALGWDLNVRLQNVYSKSATDSLLTSYATKSWVERKGYLTEHQDLSAYATQSWVNGRGYITSAALNGYATQSWVNQQGFLKSHQSLADYLTKTEASNTYQPKGNYLTSHQSLDNYVNRTSNQTVNGRKTFTGGHLDVCAADSSSMLPGLQIGATGTDAEYPVTFALSKEQNVWSKSCMYFDKDGNVVARWKLKVYNGTASQVLMADGSVQTHYKSANVTSATADDGMITPKAMNDWTSKTFLKLTGGTMTSTTKVGNLNADLLDGYHEDKFFRDSITGWTEEVTTKNILTTLPGGRSGSYLVYNAGWHGSAVVFHAFGSNSGLAFYRPGGSNSIPKILTALNGNSEWTDRGTILTSLSGTATAATKLATARTIWGQSFDGTGNVSGLIKADSGVQIGNTADVGWYNPTGRISAGNTTARGVNVGSLLVSNAWADSSLVPTNGVYIKGRLYAMNRLGIGTTSPDSDLHVNGSTHVTGFMRVDSGIELYGTVPFIDFHAGNGTSDYSARIGEYSPGVLTVEGDLLCTGTVAVKAAN